MVTWITHVPGISNFRDLSPGPSFPRGLIYRSADLSQLQTSSLPLLADLVDIILDVRSEPEVQRNGTVGPIHALVSEDALRQHGIRRIHAPIFKETDYSPAAIAQRHALYQSGADGFVAAYRGILDHCGPTLVTLFAELSRKASREPQLKTEKQHDNHEKQKGILIHCSAGKDRTGILCAILLLLAGVDGQSVAAEYALTTRGLATQKERIIKSLGDVAPKDVDKINIMMSSDAEVMKRTISVIDQDYGGVEALIKRSVPQKDFERVKELITTSAASGKM